MEQRRERRAMTDSPGISGPRQHSTPVKRRPLPTDPASASASPHAGGERRALPVPGEQYHTPPRQPQFSGEHTPASQRRTMYNQQQPQPVEHRSVTNESFPSFDDTQSDPFAVQPIQQYDDRNSVVPSEHSNSMYGYPEHQNEIMEGGRGSQVGRPAEQLPYPLDDGPPDPYEPIPNSMRQSFSSSRGASGPGPHSKGPPVPLPHAHSEPVVPHLRPYNAQPPRQLMHHAYSENQIHESSRPNTGYGLPPGNLARQADDGTWLFQEPEEYEHTGPGNLLQGPESYESHSHADYAAMQPTVEDDEPPPPPPVHRNSAPNSLPRPRPEISYYTNDMAPAPLNLMPSRKPPQQGSYNTPLSNGYGSSPGYPSSAAGSLPRGFPPPQSSSPYGQAERRLSGDAMMAMHHRDGSFDRSSNAYSSPPEVQRRPVNRITVSRPNSNPNSSPASYNQQQPAYQTPPRNTHPLANQQNAAYSSSPAAPYHTPADVSPAPLIKPRPVSPAAPPLHALHQTRSQNSVTRKSVSPRPASSGTDLSIPFSPDSFDAFNPNATKSATSLLVNTSHGPSPYSTPPQSLGNSLNGNGLKLDQSIRQSPYNQSDRSPDEPIRDLHGNIVDPSDHLPVDSWAPEPERKSFSFKPQIMPRERDRLTGARSLGNSPANSAGGSPYSTIGASQTTVDLSSPVTLGSSLVSTVGNSRNKLQKRRPQSAFVPSPAPQSPLHGPGAAGGAGNYPFVNSTSSTISNRSSYLVGMGGAPPIPAKIPLEAGPGPGPGAMGNMDRLNEEMSRIDIGLGPGSGALTKRSRGRNWGF